MAHPRRVGASIRAPQQARRGSREPLDLRELAEACRRLEALKRAAASPTSPLSTPLHQQAKTLQDAVCCHLNFTQERASADLLADLEAHLSAVQQHFLRFLILEEFHTRNPETGRVGGLNALFASRFILQENFDTGSMSASMGPGGGFRHMMDVINPSPSQTRAVRHFIKRHIQTPFFDANTRLHPRYVQTYKKMEDTRYDQSSASTISTGSFASVRMVKHTGTQEELALKTFDRKSDRAQIRYEIGILQVCDHPNILKLVEAILVSTEDGKDTMSIVMRPWAPFTLREFLESSDKERKDECPWFRPGSPQSDLCVYKIMQQLADAVVYLHRLTYEYLAPEQVSKKASGLPADVWQLGCCFAMLLAVSKAGTLGFKRLWDSFCLTGSCQIAGEHGHFMKSFGEIYLLRSRADCVAYSLVSSMLNQNDKARINIEGVLASVEDLIRQASEGGGRGVTMAG
ncbi:hypothetical protein CDV31_005017 [Fusarium ambrosium]|uniref:Protein kinase domain-containing protein n=1 Tax=Fusarium ambrosium TaxID=131363 RepID=A0A428UMB1_9HYPO|nr:hypothetical protein CDV31_005017 [Fusarium ambrosium]